MKFALLFLFACVSFCLDPVGASENALIINGKEVDSSDPIAKTTVALAYKSDVYCSASILSDRVLITAAHCVSTISPENIEVVFGAHSSDATDHHARVSQIRVSDSWSGDQSEGIDLGDIALLKYEGGLPDGFTAIALEDKTDLQIGEWVTLAEFGLSKLGDSSTYGVLRSASVQTENPHLGKTEVVFDQSKGQGACHGDSGGPALLKNTAGKFSLVAITSRNYPPDAPIDCAHSVVYTKVGAYLDWIAGVQRELQRD